ncbi:hypothetical protein [Streptomyces sp. NBC_01314]|uniref:hypothetical protein n=1 Tax=Streptomyces sp. NBC_01314 TaxID=2903821 RepID=UPI00352E7F81
MLNRPQPPQQPLFHGLTARRPHRFAPPTALRRSDLPRVDTDTVGLLYETGDFGAYETITFRRLPLAYLTGVGAAVSP